MNIIRRLSIGEGQLYRAVRLESLRESPDAFSSRYDDAIKRSEQSWAEQADASAEGSDRATFIILNEHPVGLAALYRDEKNPDVGELIQMWVAPELRGGSSATDLLSAIFHWARSNRFSRVKAEVIKNNLRALGFYKKLGFVELDAESHDSEPSVLLTKAVE